MQSRHPHRNPLTCRLARLRVVMTWLSILVPVLTSTGCNGRSIKEDNPVFTAAPPRRSLVNQEADEEERRIAQLQQPANNGNRPAGFEIATGELTGTSVVALVNGRPVFLDDVLGGVRQIIEADPRIPAEAKQQVLLSELSKRIEKYTDDELVVQAVEKKIPADRRKTIEESLEPRFQEILDGIREKEGKTTIAELDDFLMGQGTSVDQLRQSFLRMQMVEGYITSVAKAPEKVDREDLLRYYEDHLSDYTPEKQVRFSKIVIRFSDHGGESGAQQTMGQVVAQLDQGVDFGEVARTMSDSNADMKGDMGWVRQASLTEEMAAILNQTPVGSVSNVQRLKDRLEIYKVTDRNDPRTIPFAEVQKEIEEQILTDMKQKAREKVREDIQKDGHVEMIVKPRRKEVTPAIMN
ncbi:MAG: peptidyl-prolyl cis-trans isomerase [Planctomycetaceae bacterium]|nr:peptidyl-prolyl cis-trans isomerase [Planctomycetaceae bacterium]